ncbi:MAG: hypothetical protein JWR63_3893 [Conexibacter sp.]|nr:hypothetical protein [Conexibacter sp.]
MLTKTLAAATASALLAGGAVAYTGAAAETHAPKQHAGPPATVGQRLARRQDRAATRQAELAQRLGVSAETLKAADGALLKRNLDVRVAAGKLTVAQRSAILACRAAPLTCDRTNLPAKAKGRKARDRRAAKRRQHATRRMEKRAGRLAAELHLDQAKVLAALEAQRAAHHKKG